MHQGDPRVRRRSEVARANCNRFRKRFHRKLTIGVLAGAAVSFLFALPAKATESYHPDQAILALRSFVQLIETGEPQPVEQPRKQLTNAVADRIGDDSGAKLRDYAQKIDNLASSSRSGSVKVAEADYVVDELRDLFGKKSNAAPAAKASTLPQIRRQAVEASYVGTKACLGCHTSQAATFEKTLMGRIGKTQKGKFDCENCHGPGSAHVKAGGGRGVGGIISFRPQDLSRTAKENNAICLNCHEKGDRTYWNGSTHETRGLMCTNCHTIMKEVSRKKQLKTAFEVDTCFQCHKDRRAQLYRSSHMPLREGKITCSDCHNPHGSFTEALLRENSINDTCYKCHAEKRGPYLFEHAPVRENCLNCHDPHGSVNEALLKISRPRLCAECHGFDHEGGIATGPTTRFSFARACNNCHTKVHGSNHPSGALLQR